MNTQILPETQKWLQMSAIVNQNKLITDTSVSQSNKLFFSRLISENLLVFFLQYMGLMLSTVTQQSFPLWLASGTACAFTFLRGITVLPGIWLGSFAAYYFAKAGFCIAFECATIFTLQAQLLLWLSYRFNCPSLIFYRPLIFIKFIFTTALLTGIAASALIIVCYSFLPNNTSILYLWLQWWLANFIGILILSCALITWDAYFPEIYLIKKANKMHLGLFYGVFITLILMLLFTYNLLLMAFIGLTILLMSVGISLYYGWCGSISALFILAFLFSLNAYLKGFLFMDSAIVFLQLFFAIEIIVSMFFAMIKELQPFTIP